MKLSNYRYEEIKRTIIDMFSKHDIRQIPIDCFEICQKMDIILKPYSRLTNSGLAEAMNASPDGFCLQREEGFAPFCYKQWYIFYNDSLPNKRVRFTIMHEIAHIVLDHSEHSELAETEANYFAKYALAPPPLVHRIQPHESRDIAIRDIAIRFDLSHQCAEYALSFYLKWLKYGSRNYLDYERTLLSLFDEAV